MNQMMAREIAAQAGTLVQCVAPLAQSISTIDAPKGRIFAGGCGDSAFAPAALAGVFSALDIDVLARTSMQLAGFTRFEPTDTVVLSSISGGTRRTLETAQTARAAGARVIALTCKAGSALDDAATSTILFPFTPLSRKTPHTLDYGVTLLTLTLIGLAWSGRSANSVIGMLEILPRLLEAARRQADLIARQMSAKGKLFILGAGPELASAEYGAAKFHEAGGLIAIAAETENFIHGMNFMVEPEDTILALAGNSPGATRGQQLIDNFTGFVTCAQTITPPSFAGEAWQSEFSNLLSTTFVLQSLCLAFADRQALLVEQPRAGRANGQTHLAIQSRIMGA